MAPVGRVLQNGKSLGAECGLKESIEEENGSDNEVKDEPPDINIVYEGKNIKLEEEDDDIQREELAAFMAMNEDEGCVIKKDESNDDITLLEKQKSDTLYETTSKPEKGEDQEKESGQSPADIVGESGKALICNVCGKQFTRIYYFNQHIKSHKMSVFTSVAEKPFKCQECGKTFAQLQHLTGHSRTHIAGKYYECPICKRKFTELSNLTMHLLKTHPDEKPYKCPECDKQFTQSSALKKHLRTHSTTTSQEDLDRIDTLFFIDDGTEREMEPVRKKIKLEREEDRSSPHKEKVSPPRSKPISMKEKSPLVKDKSVVAKESPAKEKPLQPKVSLLSSQEISQPLESQEGTERAPTSSADVPSEAAKAPLMKELLAQANVTTVLSQQLPNPLTKPSPPSSSLEAPTSPSQDLSAHNLSTTSAIKTAARSLLSPTSKDPSNQPMKESLVSTNILSHSVKGSISSQSKPTPGKVFSEETCLKEPITIIHSRDLLHLRNGVPLDQVKCPQIKVTKYIKRQGESDTHSMRILSSGNTPLKSALGTNMVNNLDSLEGKQQTTNQSTIYHGDKIFKGRPTVLMNFDKSKSEKREPSPSLEKPEGDHEVLYKCHRCEIFVDSEEKFHNHLMDHTGVKLCECRFCGKDFTKMSSLKKHLYLHATGAIAQDCTRCGKSYSSFRELKDHAAINKCNASGSARFKCFRCRKFISSLKRLKVHLLSQCNEDPVKYYIPKKHNGSPIENTCSIPAIDSVGLSEENVSVQTGAESAKITSKNEWITQKFEKATPKDCSILSDMRGLTFEASDVDALQILTELNPADPEKEKECWRLQCQSCNQKFYTAADANVHSKAGCVTKRVSAPVTDKEYLNMKVVFEDDEKSLCHLTCSECDKRVLGVEKMLLHIKDHILEKNTLNCPVLKCGKLFKDPREFKLHLKAHTGHKPYKCSDCGKRFFLRENYETHASRHGIMKNWNSLDTIIGENIKPEKNTLTSPTKSPSTIESTISNLEVSESDADRKQKWTAHGTSQYTSDRTELQPLQNQMEEKVSQETKSYPTTVVPVISRPVHTAVVSLSVSQGSFSVASPRSYSVPSSPGSSKSGYSTASSKQSISQKDPSARLQYYRITESSRASISKANEELRKYPRSGRCEVCKKFCSRLDKHMMVHLNQKPHLCPVCPQAFRQSEHLRRHIRARHEGNHRQFECPQCHKRLTRKDKLKEHMKNCCKMLARAPSYEDSYLPSLYHLLPPPSPQPPSQMV